MPIYTFDQLVDHFSTPVVGPRSERVKYLKNCLSKVTPQFKSMMSAHGVTWDDEAITVNSEEGLKYISDTAYAISTVDLIGDKSVWDTYGITDEESMDYNGGYIVFLIDAIHSFNSIPELGEMYKVVMNHLSQQIPDLNYVEVDFEDYHLFIFLSQPDSLWLAEVYSNTVATQVQPRISPPPYILITLPPEFVDFVRA